MILLFLGAPRTATNSLWTILSKHKDIAGSKLKEPFNQSIKKELFPRCYLDEFKKKKNAKFLLDGTPCAYHFYYDIVKKLDMDIKIIYPIRNPYDRIYSVIKQIILTHAHGWWIGDAPEFIKKETLEIDVVKILPYIIHSFLDSEYLKHAYYVTNDVFITRWDKMIRTKCIEVFNFLEIEPMNEIPKTNSLDLWYNEKYKKVRIAVDNFFIEKRDKINEIILNDLKKIQNKVYVEDWIENINNT